jgi:hypothetical protein
MTCENCPNRADCKQVCKEMEAYLRENGIYRANWTRTRITGGQKWRELSNMDIEYAEKLMLKRLYGHKKGQGWHNHQ